VYTQPAKQYYFTHYTAESGLLSTEINSVLQDAQGYIWVGGTDGLQRFDGTRFKTFRHDPNDPSTITSNHIVQLLADKKNNLWVLTGEGYAGIFDTKNLRFTRYPVRSTSPEAAASAIRRLITDEYGNIFLLIAGIEVLTWNESKKEFSTEKNFFSVPAGTGVADFIQQPGTRNYWIALRKGVAVYNLNTGRLNYPGNNPEKVAAVDALAGMTTPFNFHFDKKGRCWFQSWQPGMPEAYFFYLNDKTVKIYQYEFVSLLRSYFETYRFVETKDGTMWLTGLGLFAQFIENENRFQLVYNGYRNERSISFERLTCLAEDREKNIWVGTNNNGLYRFNPSQQYFTNITHLSRQTGLAGKGSIMSFIPTRWGTLLAGSWGDGLYHYDMNFNLLPLDIKGIDHNGGITVWDMCASGDSNTIWMAAQPGIWALDQSRRSASFYNPAILKNKTVRQVVEDKHGNLWLGMNNFGLFKWATEDKNKGADNRIKRFDAVPVAMINSISVDKKGWIWAGTAVNGLYVIDPTAGKVILHFHDKAAGAFQLPEAGISSSLDIDDSSVVFTTGRYIMVYNRYTSKTSFIGSPDIIKGYITSLERGSKGYVWASTTSGIYRVNLQTKAFVLFNRNDGIDNDHFVLAASRSLPDGRKLFGSSDRFVVFQPDSIQTGNIKPVPGITAFKVRNKSLLVDSLFQLKQTELRYNNNSLEIEFSPMVYSSAIGILYKLEGLEKEWKMADKSNRAIYPYLPPGKYTFMLKTIDGEGSMSDVLTQMKIRIIPPFWKSWWFFCLLAVAAGSLLFWFDRERMKRKEAVARMRSNIADNLHGEINTALNNINILSEMARLKAEKDPEKSKEYLEQIHTKSHYMIIAMDDMLWSLDPSNDSMKKTTDRMREYIDALKNRYRVNIDIAVDQNVETLPLNMKLRHDAFLVFKEGIKNLVMLGANNCHVYIRSDKTDLLFTVLFESEHCNMQQLYNLLRRQDLERRLSMMKAGIETDFHKNHSAISLRVPVQ
jgi:ligand-binding sensor domain-containing protein